MSRKFFSHYANFAKIEARMIFDPITQTAIGNQGWGDKGTLWTFDVHSRRASQILIEGAQYLTLRAGCNGFFCLIHQQNVDQAVSIRRAAEPARELASVRYDKGKAVFRGDLDLWRNVDPAIIIHTPSGTRLRLIDALAQSVTDLDLAWYTDGNYDLNYQGLVDCMSLPGEGTIVVAVQRSSRLIIIDSSNSNVVGSIALADRGGNPELQRLSSNQFLASDYDTLCLVDTQTLTVSESALLQGPIKPFIKSFIGDYCVGKGTCAVARPFSGDVLLIDSENFKLLGSTHIGGEPLAVCLISESSVLTRDWKTGKAVIGQFDL